MASIIYKRLFEIKILHEYYLSESATNNYFSLPENQRDTLLNNKIMNQSYNIWNDLLIKPTQATLDILKGNQLRFVSTKSGFMIGARVRSEINNAGVEEFSPVIKIDPETEMNFHIGLRNQYFNNYTNLKLNRSTPAIHFFTNKNPNGDKVFPSLSRPVQPFTFSTTYEMGELAVISGMVKQAVTQTNSSTAGNWEDTKGEGFVNEADRILLPHVFNYSFPRTTSTAQFVLKEGSGAIVKDILLKSDSAVRNYALDLRTDKDGKTIKDGEFTLDAIDDTGSSKDHNLLLSEEKYIAKGFGTINISTNPSDPEFRLLKASGALITERTNGNITTAHPVFEIRLKSRQTVWRYISRNGKSLSAIGKSPDHLDNLAGALHSKSPRPLLSTPIEFERTDPNNDNSIFLPNPENTSIHMDQARHYSNIYVSKIKNLIDE